MATRKLQTEIERTLKKVSEGLEDFHDTLEKLESATSPSQKEKIEIELKKEIKKLQRLRDLIKGWQAMSELKDKTAINEARRSIELEMERFKALEKEMKIKAYSKEGLSQTAKLDPQEQEKMKTFTWVNTAVDKLNTQKDALEAELESLQIQSRKSKRLDSTEKQKRFEALPATIERHKVHIRTLEKLLRFMGNDRVTPQDINAIKDDVEYYIEAFDDAEFVPDDQLYDQFDLPDEDFDSDSDSDAISDSGSEQSVSHVQKKAPEVKKQETKKAQPVAPVPQPAAKSAPSAADRKKAPEPAPVAPAKQTPQQAPAPAASAPLAVPKVSGPSFASAIAASVAPVPSSAAQHAAPASTQSGQKSGHQQSAFNPRQVLASIKQQHPFVELTACAQRIAKGDGSKASAADLIKMLESSFQHCPDGAELDRSRTFVPQQPYSVPSYYPSQPAPILENPSIFERFDLDTLFFIFYYQQQTYAQFLSARELKRQSWRFHKKFLTWFQRHEEPKSITDDFEQGTYVYFDYEGSWSQRKKVDFTFEYCHLEDEEAV